MKTLGRMPWGAARVSVAAFLILFGLFAERLHAVVPFPGGGNTNLTLGTWSFSDTNWLSSSGHAPIAFTNLANDWVVGGRTQGPYTTRPAPPSHNNPLNSGGATEVLPQNPNDVRLDWFHMPN